MDIRVVSDLHVDVNRDGDFGFRHKKQDILLIAGDIAGSAEREIKFLTGLSSHVQCPIFAVPGNHLGYEYKTYFWMQHPNPLMDTKQESIDRIKKNIPENVHYLDNEYYDIGDYIIFGGCMYSDYLLYENEELSKRSGESYLNDFRYVHIYDKKEKVVRPVNTDDYQAFHKIFVKKLKKCLKETDKDIIVLTHFVPSLQCISEKYLKQGNIYLNASYASNMDQFIVDNPRIKYWICGHCHDSKDITIGQCRVVMEPYGYHVKGEQKQSPRKWYGKLITNC